LYNVVGDIMKKAQKPKKRIVRFRHRLVFSFFRFVFLPIFIWPYRYHYQRHRLKKDGPYLILGNHTCMIDPILLSYAFDFPIYFVSSEQIFNLGFATKILRFLVHPLKKAKSVADIGTIKEIKQTLKEGGSVGMFVEGNVTYTGENPRTPRAIGKLIRHLQVPVIFYQMRGLYFTDPRWSVYRKKGYAWGEIKRILFPTEIAKLTDEELAQLVIDELYVNAYEVQKKYQYLYKGKKRAEGLERLIFACPKCHQMHAITTKDNEIRCTACQAQGTYLETGLIESKEFDDTLIEIDRKLKDILINYLQNLKTDTVISTNPGLLWNSLSSPKTKIGYCDAILTNHGIRFVLKNEVKAYSYEEIQQVSIQGKHKIIIYLKNGGRLLFDGLTKTNPKSFSPYLYLLTFQYYKYLQSEGGFKHEITSDILGL
jgi:1-acyl-sn-glycerol-3-phosphate acyltransferase